MALASAVSTAAEEVRHFAGWEIRPQQRALLVSGEPVKLGSRSFDVLWALVERAGRVVSKAELLDAAWPGLVVEQNNLSVQISTLRKVIGAAAIVNVTGIGYKLAALSMAQPLAAPAPPPSAELAAAPSGGPALIGRDAELATLATQIGRAPLISIVGTGGVGKTALARALLARALEARPACWPDGVHWIDLTAVQPGVPLLPLVARTLGVLSDDAGVASGDVVRSLAGMQALVALDNCEHLLDAVTGCVAQLLRAAPALRWLATTQEPLHVAGEHVHRLQPLPTAPTGPGPARHAGGSALDLFVLRAGAADHGFVLDDGGTALAIDICRALDGLPLALEIAAARVATLGLRGVHDQLRRRLALRSGRRDAPARHHTLRDTYGWSYGLLSPPAQRLFRRLQPFHGGFTAAMVRRMAEPLPGEDAPGTAGGIDTDTDTDTDVDDTLMSLLDKSLVQRMPDGASGSAQRYMLLDSARDFAALQLQAAGEADAVLRRHAEAVAESFDGAWDAWLHGRDADWSARHLPERGNAGTALAWACGVDEPELLARLVTAHALLDQFGESGAGLVKFAVRLDVLWKARPPRRARACLELGWAYFYEDVRESGIRLLQQALDDFESTGDAAGHYLALVRLIRLHHLRPGLNSAVRQLEARLMAVDPTQMPLRLRLYCDSTVGRVLDPAMSVDRLQQMGRIARQAGFDTQAAICHTNVTDALLLQRRFDEAVAVAGEVLQQPTLLRERAFVSLNAAHALVCLGRYDEARAASRLVLRVAPRRAHTVIDLFAFAAARQARWEDAALMAGCSARIKQDRDCSAEAAEALLIAQTLQLLNEALAPADLACLLELGAAMASADVLAIAGLA